MAANFGVFVYRPDSRYDDHPSEKYQFPTPYLSRISALVGKWVLYYEPTKVIETRGYFAAAQVEKVIPDPHLADMFVAVIVPGSYVEFGNSVPFRLADQVVERGVLNERGKLSGRAQAAVRHIAAEDFNRIIDLGFEADADFPSREPGSNADGAFAETQESFDFQSNRNRIDVLTSRQVRDKSFRKVVVSAYAERCAMTGLRLINGGGRAEVEAAHIIPVNKGGPDTLRNGIALSGTAHWMFDRGLLGLEDDLKILVSRQVNDRDAVLGMINRDGYLRLPARPFDRPHTTFTNWHLENCFKY